MLRKTDGQRADAATAWAAAFAFVAGAVLAVAAWAAIPADPKGRQVFTLDVVGNWSAFKASATDGGTWDLDQTRSHNKVNEIDNDDDHANDPSGSISGGKWVLPKQDARGNTMEGPKAPCRAKEARPRARSTSTPTTRGTASSRSTAPPTR
jgi:hypothetical protein